MSVNYTKEILDALESKFKGLLPLANVEVNRKRRLVAARDFPSVVIVEGSLSPTDGCTFDEVMNDLAVTVALKDKDVDSKVLLERLNAIRWDVREMLRADNPLELANVIAIGVADGLEPETENLGEEITGELQFRFSILFKSPH